MGSTLSKSDFLLVGNQDKPIPSEPKWLNYPSVANHVAGDTFYADVINHYNGMLNYPDHLTMAHETTHMINADIRNQHGDGIKICGFYVGQNKCCIMPQPNMRKSAVGPFVPQQLRGDRYNLYVVGQTEWDDSPLNLYDEWTAYNNGAKSVVQEVELGTYKGDWTDAVAGPLDFVIIALAVVLTTEHYDPNYLKTIPDFLRFTNWNLHNSEDVYKKGSVMKEFSYDRQDQFLKILQTDSSASDLRRISKQYFGSVFLI